MGSKITTAFKEFQSWRHQFLAEISEKPPCVKIPHVVIVVLRQEMDSFMRFRTRTGEAQERSDLNGGQGFWCMIDDQR